VHLLPFSNSFQAAAQFPDFKLFYSFDMTVTACASDTDGAYLRNKVTKYSSSPNMLKVNNKVFVSTFAGDGWQVHGLIPRAPCMLTIALPVPGESTDGRHS
jgi:hypothetical protein